MRVERFVFKGEKRKSRQTLRAYTIPLPVSCLPRAFYTFRKVKEMSPILSNKVRVKTGGDEDRYSTDCHRVSKLLWPSEDDGRGICTQLEKVLK